MQKPIFLNFQKSPKVGMSKNPDFDKKNPKKHGQCMLTPPSMCPPPIFRSPQMAN